MNACGYHRRALHSAAGFTLLEVVLAIGITIGLMAVALFFYQQAAGLRTQALQEAERLATVRLLLDRLTTELRTARRHEVLGYGLVGAATFLEFVRTDLPSFATWQGGTLGRSDSPETDLKLLSYSLSGSLDGSEGIGVWRHEEPLVEFRRLAVFEAGDAVAAPVVRPGLELLTEQVRYLRFRYWNGTSWQETWEADGLPLGIEVSLGIEPLPAETPPAEYPYEVFRRVIHLPAGEALTAGLVSDEDTVPDTVMEEGP